MRKAPGFTLIEMIVVIAIMGMVMAVALPVALRLSRTDLKATTRTISETVRRSYDETFMRNRPHRIVWNLDRNAYWVEVADEEARIFRTPEQRQAHEEFLEDYARTKERLTEDRDRERERQRSNSLLTSDQDSGFADLFTAMFSGGGKHQVVHPADYKDSNGFAPVPGMEPISLPKGIHFTGVATYAYEDIVRPSDGVPDGPEDEARVTTVFFPSGYVEDTVVYISDGEREWSLILDPLTGAIAASGQVEPLPRYEERLVEE